MSRSERLLSLLHMLRRHRRPVSGASLAQELGISIRTLYRDIESLRAQGANIEGEQGFGYVLRPGFMLPPLMFTQAELEALALGSRMVEKFADRPMAEAATDALAKISGVLPVDLKHEFESAALLVGPRAVRSDEAIDLRTVRAAIRSQRKLRMRYRDGTGAETERTIWPFALGYFETMRILAGWCEKREDFRHFRTDRIAALATLEERYQRGRTALLREWRERGSDVAHEPR